MHQQQCVEIYQPNNRTRLFTILGLAILLMGVGVFLTPRPADMLNGITIILTHPSRIDFDSFFWTQQYGFGAPFFQVGLNLLAVCFIYLVTKTEIKGIHLAAMGMVVGFGFYGKNVLNMWFPILGVFLYTKLKKRPLSSASALALFCTCMGPIFSTLFFDVDLLGNRSPLAFGVAAFVTTLAGFLAAVFADYFPKLHGGLLLYNAGLASGWAAILIYSTMKALRMELEAPIHANEFITGKNLFFAAVLSILFAYFIVVGLLLKGAKQFAKIVTYKSPGGDHTEKFGFGATFMYMGVVGFVVTAYLVLMNAQINGMIFAGLWATVSFAAFGSTLRTQWPITLGVVLGAFLTGGFSGMVAGDAFMAAGMAKVISKSMVLAALFVCGVAPIVGNYGKIAGLVVGMVHSVVVTNIGVTHGWMCLYNNGLCLGLIVVLLYPVYSTFKKRKSAPEKPLIPEGAAHIKNAQK